MEENKRNLAEQKQRLLNDLYALGLNVAEIRQISGANETTIRKYRQTYLGRGGTIPAVHERFAVVWHRLKGMGHLSLTMRERGQVHDLILEPFKQQLEKLFIPDVSIHPQTGMEKLWIKVAGRNDWTRIQIVIESAVEAMMWRETEKGRRTAYPTPDDIVATLRRQFYTADYLPDWPGRAAFLEKALSNLTTRESDVIKQRLGIDGQPLRTQADISRDLNVTPERVRHIESRAIAKLRAQVRRQSMEGTIGELRAELVKISTLLAVQGEKFAASQQFNDQLLKTCGEVVDLIAKATKCSLDNLAAEVRLARVPDLSLEELDFSRRTYTCLRRGGLLTFGQIASAHEYIFTSIRGFGRKCLIEVKDKLQEHGLELLAPPPVRSLYAVFDDDEDDDF